MKTVQTLQFRRRLRLLLIVLAHHFSSTLLAIYNHREIIPYAYSYILIYTKLSKQTFFFNACCLIHKVLLLINIALIANFFIKELQTLTIAIADFTDA